MNMKRLGIYTVVTTLLSVGIIASANAQSKFEGAYGQLGIGYENITPTFNSSGLNIVGVGTAPISTNVSSQGSVMGVVTIGYMAPITKDFLLGIGAEYNPFNSQSGNYNYGVGNVRVNGTYQSQNQYNIFISPATPIGTDGLLYGKVGYTGTSVKATEGGSSGTQNLTGYSLGLGYKQIIQGGLYGFGELNYMSYSNNTNSYSGVAGGYAYNYSMTSSANVFNAVVGIGYKF
jgi:hypothetical protein